MTPAYEDALATVYLGDVREVLSQLPSESVHTVVTSPPYWGLRDYGVEGQLGLEPTPEEFVANMVAVFREVRRVLRKDGTLWLNLGDSYAASRSGPVGDYSTLDGGGPEHGRHYREAQAASRWAGRSHTRERFPSLGIKPKDLVGMPWRVAFALQADGWYLRADIIWSKPNPMPESVTDRPTKAHEYVFLLSRSERYFYDAEAIREPGTTTNPALLAFGAERPDVGFVGRSQPRKRAKRPEGWNGEEGRHDGIPRGNGYKNAAQPEHSAHRRLVERVKAAREEGADHNSPLGPGGRNKRSVWEIATQPYPEAHFATYPEKLVEPCILAGTSARGCCPECGAPWVRETKVDYVKSPVHGAGSVVGRHEASGQNNFDGGGMPRLNKVVETTGWRPGCSHDLDPIPCVVLDPFAGSGTTLAVAKSLDRRGIGIELNPEYLKLLARRLERSAAQTSLLPLTEEIG